MRNLFFLIFFGLFISGAWGQNNIKTAYKNAVSTPNFLNICGDPRYGDCGRANGGAF